MSTVFAQIRAVKSNFSVFLNRNYMLLFFGGLISRIGSGVHYVGVCWYVLERSGSGVFLGTIMFFATLTGIVLGPISGVIVDRFDRKKLIIWMDILRGVVVLIMAELLRSDKLTYPILLIGTVGISICSTLFNPAISATIPNLVKDDELSKVNSLENLSMNLTGVIGASLGGVLIGIYGVTGIFFVNGVSFILSALSEVFIEIPPRPISVRQSDEENLGKTLVTQKKLIFFTELWGGIKFIFSNRLLSVICGTSIIMNFFFVGALGIALPYVVKEVLGMSEVRFGLMDSFFPAGAILGAGVMIFLPEIKRFYRLTVVGLALHGVILGLIGFTVMPYWLIWLTAGNAYKIIAGLMLIMGVVNVVINIPFMTLFQRFVPDEVRGRFFALLSTFTQGLIPFAYLISGLFLTPKTVYLLMIIGGVAIIFGSYWMTRVKEFHRL